MATEPRPPITSPAALAGSRPTFASSGTKTAAVARWRS